jgi:hypothetical protein
MVGGKQARDAHGFFYALLMKTQLRRLTSKAITSKSFSDLFVPE